MNIILSMCTVCAVAVNKMYNCKNVFVIQAEYLFVNNPEGHMMDPTEAETQEELLNKPQGAMKIDSKACFA